MRKHAEAMLQESEQRYRRITEGLTDYLYTVRVQDGRAVETTHSEACVSVTGYRSEEFAAFPYLWLDMVVPEDRDHVIEYVKGILAGKQMSPIEHRIMRKDGQIRWVSDMPIVQVDSLGRLISYDGVIRDITERKHAETALQESEEKFRLLFEKSADAILLLDGDTSQTVTRRPSGSWAARARSSSPDSTRGIFPPNDSLTVGCHRRRGRN